MQIATNEAFLMASSVLSDSTITFKLLAEPLWQSSASAQSDF